MEREAKWLRRLGFASFGMMGLVLFALAAGVYNTVHINTLLTDLKIGQVTLQTDVSALKIDVSKLKTDVSALQTDVSKLKTDVANIYTILQDNGTRQ